MLAQSSAESAAMWDLVTFAKEGGTVATTTTVELLKRQLSKDPRIVYMAQVEYVDWSAPNILRGVFDPVIRKNKGYEHEAEVRLFFWDIGGLRQDGVYSPDEVAPGLTFAVDLQQLITQVWVGPREKASTRSEVGRLILEHGLTFQIKDSNLMMTRRLAQRGSAVPTKNPAID